MQRTNWPDTDSPDSPCESTRLVYEPLRVDHAAELFPALGDSLVSRHLNCAPPQSIDELAEDFRRRTSPPPQLAGRESWINFAIRLKADRRCIGRVEATVYTGWAEVAYLLGPQDWGQGYASESLAWLQNFISSDHRVFEFWACVAPDNLRSIRLLLRCGYQQTPPCNDRSLKSYDLGDIVFRLLTNRNCADRLVLV